MAQRVHELFGAGGVFDAERYGDDGRLVAFDAARQDVFNVDLGVGDAGQYFSQDALAVVAADFYRDGIEILLGADVPVHVDDAHHIVAFAQHVGTVGAVDGYAAAARDVADDLVAWYRVAALGEVDEKARFAFDENAVAGFIFIGIARLDLFQHLRDIRRRRFLEVFFIESDQLAHDAVDGEPAVADRGKHIVQRLDVELLGHLDEAVVLDEILVFVAEVLGFIFQQLHAAGDVFFALLLFKPLAYFGARLRRGDDVEPVGAGAVVLLVGDDRYDVAVLQFVFQRHDLAVYLGADAVIADICVNVVGEVDGIGAFRQVDDVAARRVDEYFIGEDIYLQRFKVFARIGEFVLQRYHLAQPGQFLIVFAAGADALVAGFFVLPVGRDTVFRYGVHGKCPYLDLERNAVVGDDRRVERLVAVRLGHGDVVFKASRQRLPHGVDDAQHRVAFRYRLHEHAHGQQVEDVGQLFVALFHLAVNAVEMLGAPFYFAFEMDFVEFFLNFFDGGIDEALAFFALLLYLVHEIVVRFRLQVAQTEIFKLPFDIGDAEAVGQRRVYFERFAGDALLLFLAHVLERAHIVQAVGQFDHDDADILGHRQKHLAVCFQLLIFLGLVLHAAELCHAVDEHGHFVAEHLFHLVDGIRRIFYDIVQQRCGDGDIVDVQLREDHRYVQRMRYIFFTGDALLIGVCFIGQIVSL